MTRKRDGIGRRQFLRGATGLSLAVAAAPSVAAVARPVDIPADLTDLSAARLSEAIRQRQLSCVEVMHAYLDRIESHNAHYNAIVSMLDRDRLVDEARRADRELEQGKYRGWMHGMPHAVKDLADAKGLETSNGSPIFAGTVATSDTLFIERIRRAGAIFIGKTNTPEFGLGSQSYNPVHGTTGNAFDPRLTSGGSSGGAAVGLATRMLPVADGSDMMGSLRNPAGFNNVVGFRPSQGRVPSYPKADGYYQQLGVAGPMGRNVEDTVRLLGTMAGFDARDPLSRSDSIPGYAHFRAATLRGFRIGWMADYDGYLATEDGVLPLCKRALSGLSEYGVNVEPCKPDYDMARLWQTWLTFRHWALGGARELYEDPEKRRLLKPEIQWEIEGSFKQSGREIADAGIARTDWYRALLKLFDSHDVLALPAAQVFPFDKTVHWPGSINGRKMDTYHRWMEVVIGGTLAGLPVVCLPAGFSDDGRPMGIQFLGRPGQDQQVLEFAMACERVTDFLERRPPAPPA
ncbi:MAG: amidase [Gammaproteobacteria bacterium]|nr:amidase [Gammaproteobacteria bacterium]